MVGFGSYLGAFLRGFLVVTQSLVLERSLGRIEGKEEKALLKLIIYHNLFVKVGVLHLLVLVAHDVSCCFMLISYLCFCVVLVCFDACWVCLGGIVKYFLVWFSFSLLEFS